MNEKMDGTQTCLFDAKTLESHIGGDAELLRELVSVFVEDSPGRLAELEGAVDAGDAVEANRKAHALKGMYGIIRVNGMADLALQMEREAGEGKLELVVGMLPGLRKQHDRLLGEMRAFLRATPIRL